MTLPNNLFLLSKFLLMHFYYRIDHFIKSTALEIDKSENKVLDIGAADYPYRHYFHKCQYFGLDIHQNSTKTINYLGDIQTGIKELTNNSFNYVLCTQVIEHLTNPEFAFKEIARLLKKGGKLYLTTNFIYHIHSEPQDYFRFTSYGLESLGAKAKLRLIHLKPHGGIFSVISYIITTLPLRLGLDKYLLTNALYVIVFSPIIVILNLIAVALDYLDKDKKLTINYEAIYEK